MDDGGHRGVQLGGGQVVDVVNDHAQQGQDQAKSSVVVYGHIMVIYGHV